MVPVKAAPDLSVILKTSVPKSEREAFRVKAQEAGQTIASRIAWLIRRDLRGEK